MAGIRVEGNVSGNVAEVDASNNLQVKLPTEHANVGSTRILSESDDGTVLGTATLISPEATRDYRLRVAQDSILFNQSFEGIIISRDRIQQNDTTMTAAQASGFLTLNSGGSVTTAQGTNIRTYRTFPMYGSFSLYAEFWVRIGNPTATNAVSEFGLGYCSGVTVQLTDGVYVRVLSGGQMRLVITNNSVDILTADVTETDIPARDGVGAFDITEVNHYALAVYNDSVDLWINNTLCATIKVASPYGSPASSMSLPAFARVYNAGAASAARSIGIGFLNVTQGEMANGKPWSHQMVGSGGGSYQIQPGTTSGPTVTRGAGTLGWPTSATARAAGTWTATTAPALNSLGGIWTSPAISTLTTEADYPVFSYQNPVGTATLSGKTLYITGVRVGETAVIAAASTNAITLTFGLAVGGTSSATTQTEAAAVVAARITALGQVAFTATAAVGEYKPGFEFRFDSPLVVYPGHFMVFIVRPFGTVASNTLTVTGTLGVNGYFE